MSIIQLVIRAAVTILSGNNMGVLNEISDATGVSVFHLAGMSRTEILQTIRDAGISFSDIPPHIVSALGLVRAG